jgi:benzoate/toluate 1,2-dioxygenase alpha subunit
LRRKGESDQARALRIRQYEDFFNVSGMGTPDDLEEFSACQRGYLGENLAWSDLSRGALHWVDGRTNTPGRPAFAAASGVKSEDEALYIAHHHHWQNVMLAALETEQQRYDQSITQRVEVV